MESQQSKLDRVRKPRVHIKYEVETEGAVIEKELPFVVGVMGDFSGDPTQKLADIKDRKFVNIDRDNFDQVMSKMSVGLNLRVANKLSEEGGEINVPLKFSSMEDFDPARIVQQVEPLRRLMQTREQLRDLLAKADRSDNLEKLLENILKDQDAVKKLAEELGKK